jgi:hypothetical protein
MSTNAGGTPVQQLPKAPPSRDATLPLRRVLCTAFGSVLIMMGTVDGVTDYAQHAAPGDLIVPGVALITVGMASKKE